MCTNHCINYPKSTDLLTNLYNNLNQLIELRSNYPILNYLFENLPKDIKEVPIFIYTPIKKRGVIEKEAELMLKNLLKLSYNIDITDEEAELMIYIFAVIGVYVYFFVICLTPHILLNYILWLIR